MRALRYFCRVIRRAIADTRQFLREHLLAEFLLFMAVIIVNLFGIGDAGTRDSVIYAFAALGVFVALVFFVNLALAPVRLAQPTAQEEGAVSTARRPIGQARHSVGIDSVGLTLLVDTHYLSRQPTALDTLVGVVSCVVTSPSGTTARWTSTGLPGELLGYVSLTYPDDFSGARPLESGQYRVVWSPAFAGSGLGSGGYVDVEDWFAIPPRGTW
jgi:hypothetical protein